MQQFIVGRDANFRVKLLIRRLTFGRRQTLRRHDLEGMAIRDNCCADLAPAADAAAAGSAIIRSWSRSRTNFEDGVIARESHHGFSALPKRLRPPVPQAVSPVTRYPRFRTTGNLLFL